MKVALLSMLLITLVAFGESQEVPASAGLPLPPELKDLPAGKKGEMIRYGMDLLANTADWIGPKGKKEHLAKSRMSCRSCHMEVGQKISGNSWLDTQGLYPQYRAREGKVQTLADRVNVCLEHPLQGKKMDVDSYEMMSILLYYKWINRGRPSLEKDPDDRLIKLAYLSRAANPENGKVIFKNRCSQCHGENGQGQLRPDGIAFVFPPLWGTESFMMGSSMSRISLLARFIKANMPLGATAAKPLLTDEESWDVAAFVSSQDRPKWVGKQPFPALSEKPFDYPIPPYADPFPESQHLYGPFQPIINFWQEKQKSAETTSMGV